MRARVESEKVKEVRLETKRSILSTIEEKDTMKEVSKISRRIVAMDVTQSKFDGVNDAERGHGREHKIEIKSAADSDCLKVAPIAIGNPYRSILFSINFSQNF